MHTISADDKQLYDDGTLSLKGLVKAYKTQDPRLAEYVCKVVELDPYPTQTVQISQQTVILHGHTEHGMSTVYQALFELYDTQDGSVVGNDSECTYTNTDGARFRLIDGTASSEISVSILQQAMVLCLVVSIADGVMPQTRELIALAKQGNLSKIVVFLNKVDEFDEEDREEIVGLVQMEVQELLENNGFNAGTEVFHSGSAWAAVNGEETTIGMESIKRLNDKLRSVTSASNESISKVLKGYEKFRRDYHVDAIKSDVLENVKPRYPQDNSRYPHQAIRKQKAELFTQRFNEFVQKKAAHVPERLKVGEFMLMLYDDNSSYALEQLTKIVQHVPLKWGPWQAFKYILKRGILDQRWTLFALTYNRWKTSNAYIKTERGIRTELSEYYLPNEVGVIDWSDPYSYYNDSSLTEFDSSSIEITKEARIFLNKMFRRLLNDQYYLLSDETQEAVTAEVLLVAPTFRNWWNNRDIWADWAEDLTWTSTQSVDVLRNLWSNAACEDIREWAFDMLRSNHQSALKRLPTEWIVAQGCNPSASKSIREFVIEWVCATDPALGTDIPQAKFIDHGLHHVVLTFLNPEFGRLDSDLVNYACNFIRQFMERLTDVIDLDKVLWLLRQRQSEIHELGLFLLFPDGEKRSPYQSQLSLDFWTELISDDRMHSYAVKSIKERFKRQIGVEWLKNRLYASDIREVNLAETFIREGFHQSNLDFYPVYYENVFSEPAQLILYNWAWEALSKEDVQGNTLAGSNFTTIDYRQLLVSRREENRQYAIDAYRNEVDQVDFPIAFLKHLISRDEYTLEGWKSFLDEELDASNQWKAAIQYQHVYIWGHRSYKNQNTEAFAIETIASHIDCSVETLGYRWVLDRRNKSGWAYGTIRKLFQTNFPNYGLTLLDYTVDESTLEDTPEGNRAGVDRMLEELDAGLRYNSDSAKFWKPFLLGRLERSAEIRQQSFDVDASCIVSPDHFSLEWFIGQVDPDPESERSQYHRSFAMELAEMYWTDWVARYRDNSGTFGFAELVPLLTGTEEVRDFVVECMMTPRTEFATIDLMHESFTPEELFEYCYSTDGTVRSLGLEIIQAFPSRFAQPDKLVELTTSPDANVRALVIQVLYNIAHIPLVTPEWTPYENSVVPGNMERGKREKVKVSKTFPTQYAAVGTIKYLGEGTSENIHPNLTDHGRLVLFAIRQLFQLPSNPRPKSERGVEKVPSWKTKRLLIESFRDLALQDRVFAEAIVPVFQELTAYKGKAVQEVVWSALAYIEAKYEHQPIEALTIFDQV